jgi:hypothetical protein
MVSKTKNLCPTCFFNLNGGQKPAKVGRFKDMASKKKRGRKPCQKIPGNPISSLDFDVITSCLDNTQKTVFNINIWDDFISILLT